MYFCKQIQLCHPCGILMPGLPLLTL